MLIFTVEITPKTERAINAAKADFLKKVQGFNEEANKKSPYIPSTPVKKEYCQNERRKTAYFSDKMYRLIATFLLDMPLDEVCRRIDTIPDAEREALVSAIWDEYHKRCSKNV